MKKIGINGFGRIGRAVFRIIQSDKNLRIVAINDIDPLVENHAYLANYDSIYGSLTNKVKIGNNNSLLANMYEIPFYSEPNIKKVPWLDHDIDIVIDSSGLYANVVEAHALIKLGIKKVIVTHSPKDSIDQTIIIGANEKMYDPQKHHVVSASICDANACAPVLKILDKEIGIEDGFITTLHPWLGYQNLVDGSLQSVSSPGHYWNDFALGRASLDSLIPKNTTLIPAMLKALPEMNQNIHAMSFRVPTAIVSASDINLTLNKNIKDGDLIELFAELVSKYPHVVSTNEESLVSIDFKGIDQSCVIDIRWLKVVNNNKMKIVLWYDNEWGYSKRVVDVVDLVSNN